MSVSTPCLGISVSIQSVLSDPLSDYALLFMSVLYVSCLVAIPTQLLMVYCTAQLYFIINTPSSVSVSLPPSTLIPGAILISIVFPCFHTSDSHPSLCCHSSPASPRHAHNHSPWNHLTLHSAQFSSLACFS